VTIEKWPYLMPEIAKRHEVGLMMYTKMSFSVTIKNSGSNKGSGTIP
jgi:hypothetical protein